MNLVREAPDATAPTATWRLFIAPLIWATHFLAIYGFTALACARKGTADWVGANWVEVAAVPWFVGAATLIAAALLLLIIRQASRQAIRNGRSAEVPVVKGFVSWLTIGIAALSLLAVMWDALPVLLVPICQ